MQDNNYKDRLLIVDENLIGIKDRGVVTSNAVVAFNPVDFHPMVRDNWQTEDPLRGVLGAYYTRYTSTKGPTLYSYAGALNTLRAGGHVGASDQNGIGSLRTQLEGPNDGTNIIFDPPSISDSVNYPGTKRIGLIYHPNAWDSYAVVTPERENSWADWLLPSWRQYSAGSFEQPSDLASLTDPNGNSWLYEGLFNAFNFENKSFFDHTSDHYLISNNRKIREKSGTTTNVQPVYNFYIASTPSYEEVIGNVDVLERAIPNAYYLQLELRNTSSKPLDSHIPPAIQIGQQPIVVANTPDGPRPWFNISYQGVTESNIGSYYNLYSQGILNKLGAGGFTEDELTSLRRINSDVAVVHSDLAALDPEALDLTQIPFYNKITLDVEDDNPAILTTSLLRDIYTDPATRDFVDWLQALAIYAYYYQDFFDKVSFATRSKVLNDPDDLNDYTFSAPTDPFYAPLLFDFINVMTQGLGVPPEDFVRLYQNRPIAANSPFLTALPVKFLRDYFGKNPITEILADPTSLAAAYDEVSNKYFPNGNLTSNVLIDSFRRSLEEIFSNNACHHETLMYVVEKYRVEGDTQIPVQRYFISSKIDPLTANPVYYDTQIKYGVKYNYVFKKMVLVFGNEYTYPDRNGVQLTSFWNSRRIIIDGVQNNPSIKLLLVPYTSGGFVREVLDRPPVIPNLSFYPVRGSDTKLKILLNANTGEYLAKPTIIEDSDVAFYEEEYFSQYSDDLTFEEIVARPSPDNKIRFRSDDPVDKYQLFKIDTEPESYRDFAGSMIMIDPEVGIPGYYEDTIVPNRKYYYCARSVDVHDNISNPTYIFEIEMKNNQGQIFLTQKTFRFKPDKPTYSKNGRRFLYIEPALSQVVLDTEITPPQDLDTTPANNLLGDSTNSQSCWDETFKVRVTSKKTGKKIDLNLTFKNSGVTNPS